MFLYHLRMATISLRRHPMMTLLSIGAIALGITVSCAFVSFFYVYSSDPIPEKSDELFYVRLDSWPADSPADDDYPERPPQQVTYRDAAALLKSEIPSAQVVMFRSILFVTPDQENAVPDREDVRLTTRDFFAMFQAPFRYGGSWSLQADQNAEKVIVIDAQMNERYFGGTDSIGERLRLADEVFTIVGVLDTWRPPLRFYDLNSGGTMRNRPERFFIPLSLAHETNYGRSGSSSNWLPYEGGYEAFLQSETVWMQMWVELESQSQRAEYQTFLDAYTEEQRTAGRFARPTNNWIQPIDEWLVEIGATPVFAQPLMWIGLLFLGVCSVNLIGLLFAKFLTRAGEVGVRRALGAARSSIFQQFMIECWLLSFLGAVLGWIFLNIAVKAANRLPEANLALHLDTTLALIVIALALVAGLIAGVYTAWRLSTTAPAIQLKLN